MSDIVKNTVQNIVYPFYIKGNDFKLWRSLDGQGGGR